MWQLDPKLQADTVVVGDLPLCRVLLNDDANFPWLILVPRREGLVELIDLRDNVQATLISEISKVSTALKAFTRCHKLNIATLGNVVAQLHIHVIARFRGDAAWPNPVWGQTNRLPYEKARRDEFIRDVRASLQIAPLQH